MAYTEHEISEYSPAGMRQHSYQRSFTVEYPIENVWYWLNDPQTFINSQFPPYRVEFMQDTFEVGVLNNHHGPGLNLPAVITVMEAPVLRDMQYLYGSYVISLRMIRPTFIRFELQSIDAGRTDIQLTLSSWVHPLLYRLWTMAQSLFWRGFGWSATAGVRAHMRRRAE